jgi:excisionase family DNA binding protein
MTTELSVRNALSPSQASLELGLTPQRVRQWCEEGLLEHVRIGRKIWIPSSELNRILTDGLRPRRI